MKQRRSIKCPTCKKEGRWFEGDFGPFCSRRCKLIDLGKWLSEEHAISEPLPEEQVEKIRNSKDETEMNQNDEA